MGGCVSAAADCVISVVRRFRRRRNVHIRRVHHVNDSDEESVEYETLLANSADGDEEDSDVPQFTKISRSAAGEPMKSVEQILAEERAKDSAAAAALRQREEDLRLEEEAYIAERRAAALAAKSQGLNLEKENQDTNSIDSMVIPGTPVSFATSEAGISVSGSERSFHFETQKRTAHSSSTETGGAATTSTATVRTATSTTSTATTTTTTTTTAANIASISTSSTITSSSSSSNNSNNNSKKLSAATQPSAVAKSLAAPLAASATKTPASTSDPLAAADSDEEDFDSFLESVKATSLNGSQLSLHTVGLDSK